jgi:hypothetical protein
MLDIMYKLFRKGMPQKLYRIIQLSPFGRAKNWERFETYKVIFEDYKKFTHLDLKNKVVAEIGTGNQFYTALFFLHNGADTVIAVDPKITTSSIGEIIEKTIDIFKAHDCTFSLSIEEVKNRIVIASDISCIKTEYNNSIDILLSHLVLEHVPSVDVFMCHCNRLLSETGISYNIIDLSDHTYHIFIKYMFTKNIFNRRALFHLRYSDKVFKMINDDKCFMNRVLLPLYLEYANKHDLVAEILQRNRFRKVKIHHDILKKFASRKEEDLYITSFHLKLTKGKVPD